MENDRILPGTVAILGARIERVTALRRSMDEWPRPSEDDHLLAYLKQLKRQLTKTINLLNLIKWALETFKKEPPEIDEALSLEEDERRLVNRYLFGLKNHFREKAVAG